MKKPCFVTAACSLSDELLRRAKLCDAAGEPGKAHAYRESARRVAETFAEYARQLAQWNEARMERKEVAA